MKKDKIFQDEVEAMEREKKREKEQYGSCNEEPLDMSQKSMPAPRVSTASPVPAFAQPTSPAVNEPEVQNDEEMPEETDEEEQGKENTVVAE